LPGIGAEWYSLRADPQQPWRLGPLLPRLVQFGDFEADLDTGELRRQGTRIRLSPQPFQVLTLLLERPGELITREELRAKLWPDEVYVDFEHSLNAAVKKLRQALCDSPENPRYIETFPKRGYRLAAKVVATVPPEQIALAPEPGAEVETPVKAPVEVTFSPPVPTSPGNGTRKRATFYAVVSLVLVALVWVGYREFRRESARPLAPNGKTMLAVLPFDNLTGDPAREYLSDGLTEELITELGGIGPDRLGVIARTSVMGYKRTNKRVDQIGKELGVEYVLEGSLRQAADRVRIAAQLIRVSDQAHVWAQEFDSDLRDVLIMEADVARKIAAETRVKLDETPSPLPSPARVDPEAYEFYLKGRYFWNQRTNEGLHRAIQYFQQATDKDPLDARAYAGLADSYVLLGSYGDVVQNEANSRARKAARKALQLNPSLAEAHTSLAMVGPDHAWDWAGSQREFLRAIALDPNYATAHHWYGDGYLAPMGRTEEAVAEVRLAEKLDPLSPIIATDVAKELYYARRYPEATAQLKKVLELSPNYPMALEWVRWMQINDGKYADALATLELERRTLPPERYLLGKATILGTSGQRDKARELISQVLRVTQTQYANPAEIAFAYAAMGDMDNAFLWFDKACDAESSWLTGLKVVPGSAPLHSDPRYPALLRRVGLTP
jgi:TolB-like protein/DNA-binding winged helix-turn-helix (wHTH) protein/Tfp pilus assembly protein PilF